MSNETATTTPCVITKPGIFIKAGGEEVPVGTEVDMNENQMRAFANKFTTVAAKKAEAESFTDLKKSVDGLKAAQAELEAAKKEIDDLKKQVADLTKQLATASKK